MIRRAPIALASLRASLLVSAWLVAASVTPGVARALEPAAAGEPVGEQEKPSPGQFPRTVPVDGGVVVIHPPQIRAWDDFEDIEGLAAMELRADGGDGTRFGTIAFKASAVPDLEARLVHFDEIAVTSVKEQGEEVSEQARRQFVSAMDLGARDVPLDLVLSHLADGVIPESTTGIRFEPPKINVSTTPAIIVLLHGEPALAPVGDAGLLFAANTNWPLFRDGADGAWYLRDNDNWLTAGDLTGPWSWPGELPPSVVELPETDDWRSTRVAAISWSGPPETEPPRVFVSTEPAELLLIDGEPELVEIGALGLSYVKNTDSPLFRLRERWYYLVSGRWFTSRALDGRWSAVLELPEVFADIPEDHEKADVLAAVPDTPAARMAALDAQIPEKTEVPRDLSMPEAVTYVGEPVFEPIPGTSLKRATNTAFSVIQADADFYLCYGGMWYVASRPEGPWRVTSHVPSQVYQIPPSSPVYNTTYVKVEEESPVSVTFGVTQGYSSVYVSNGVPVYGTGWYYPPYYYYYGGYPIYFPYPYTYGSASFYNPATGTYGSVSRAYGPYGGWGYASAYNPNTGTYGRAEAVWDHDEWYAVGEAYNPHTGRYYGTERYYDADDEQWEIDSRFSGERGYVDVSREFDEDSGRATIETSRGGEGTFSREKSDGGWNTSGEFETADGRTITGSGRYEDGEGGSTLRGSEGGTGTVERSVDDGVVTREGSFTKDGKTIETETSRDGTGRRTSFETSEGTSGVVGGRGQQRTALAQTESGDIYAARDGNVYKKSGDGWSRHSDGSWETIPMPSRSSDAATQSYGGGDRRQSASTMNRSASGFDADRYGSLDRDFSARQRGMSRSGAYARQRGGAGRWQGRRR
jgi:hypothetical protein